MESWLIPAAPVTVVEEIKKSRFITLLAHTDGVEAAKAFVESVRAEHPDAPCPPPLRGVGGGCAG